MCARPAAGDVLSAALLAAAALGWLFASVPASVAAQPPRVVQATVHGVIHPIKVRYLARVLDEAQRKHADLVLLSIDTPGGLVTSLQEMVQLITNARIPVIGLVEPATAQATSAGALLLIATDVAAMLPDTRVGAAHPVGAGQPLEGAIEKKATNSLAALARSLAERRGRSAEAAEAMVRSSVSYTAGEALDKHLVELVVNSRAQLLRELDGRKVVVAGGRSVTLHTQGAIVSKLALSWSESLLDATADPTLASLLLTIGVLGILYELSAPGIGLGGIAGVISLLLALLSMSVVPVRLAGILLLVAGLFAIALEVKTPTHGLLGLGGLAAIAIGAIVLVDESRYFGALPHVRWGLFAPAVALTSLGVLALAKAARMAQSPPPRVGVEALPGARGLVKAALVRSGEGFSGSVFVDGARWPALADCEIGSDEPIEVVEVVPRPTRLRVKRLPKPHGEA